MEEELYPEDQIRIEKTAIEAFLFAVEYGSEGVEHLLNKLNDLKEKFENYEKQTHKSGARNS